MRFAAGVSRVCVPFPPVHEAHDRHTTFRDLTLVFKQEEEAAAGTAVES